MKNRKFFFGERNAIDCTLHFSFDLFFMYEYQIFISFIWWPKACSVTVFCYNKLYDKLDSSSSHSLIACFDGHWPFYHWTSDRVSSMIRSSDTKGNQTFAYKLKPFQIRFYSRLHFHLDTETMRRAFLHARKSDPRSSLKMKLNEPFTFHPGPNFQKMSVSGLLNCMGC